MTVAAVKLLEPLQADTAYCVKFYLCLAEFYYLCATSNVGVHFSTDSIYCSCADTLSVTPQVVHDPAVILQDTMNWMEVSGTYVAQGGERFIAIGNFLPNALTNVVLESPPGFTNIAYYYLEDVSVERCSQVGVSANALVEQQKSLNVFPNPASDVVRIEHAFRQGDEYRVDVFDLWGRRLIAQAFTNNQSLDVSMLRDGLYMLRLYQNNVRVAESKLCVLR